MGGDAEVLQRAGDAGGSEQVDLDGGVERVVEAPWRRSGSRCRSWRAPGPTGLVRPNPSVLTSPAMTCTRPGDELVERLLAADLLAEPVEAVVPYDDLVGVASGATGNPAILVYSTRMAPTERPDIGYAMIFPSMTIVKVIAAQIVGLLVAAGASGG